MTGQEIVQALRCCAEGDCSSIVTHWMPLPEAPEG
ncbi:DUF551 domain-containing protein [Gemmiger sp.]|jgi:hypothetical protein|nr:MAG TPA: Protein of unknown function (DUF551) [Caudoviricetes sp.]